MGFVYGEVQKLVAFLLCFAMSLRSGECDENIPIACNTMGGMFNWHLLATVPVK